MPDFYGHESGSVLRRWRDLLLARDRTGLRRPRNRVPPVRVVLPEDDLHPSGSHASKPLLPRAKHLGLTSAEEGDCGFQHFALGQYGGDLRRRPFLAPARLLSVTGTGKILARTVSMAEPDDSESVPIQRLSPSADGSPLVAPGLSDSTFAAMFAAGTRQEIGPWQFPSSEDLQRSLPQFEIIALLGRGGMGAVYKGLQRSLDRFVAIKILPSAVESSDLDFATRFEREAKSMARLKHPGIIPVHDAGETADGLLYFVMDYVDGTDLQKTLAARRLLPPGEALGLARQVCDALAYAHRHGVIHRDIKPSNIMVDRESQIHIADFGIAHCTGSDGTKLTQTHLAFGSPDFIAPESHLGMNQVDHRADVYAVGVVLYLMLTGHVPRGRFEPPSHRVPGLDTRVDAVVDRAMQTDPERRYASATEMRADLDRILAESPAAQAAPLAPRKEEQRLRARLWIASATTISLLAAGALFLELRARNPDSATSRVADGTTVPTALPAITAATIKLWDGPAKIVPSSGVQWENGAVRLDQAVLRSDEMPSRDAIFSAQIRMNPDSVSPQIGVRSRGRPEDGNKRHYVLGFAKLSVDMVELMVSDDRQFQVLAHWPLPRAYGVEEWATLELRAIGDQLTASLDGQLLGVVHDTSIMEPGGVVLSATAAGYFRNIVYLPLDKHGDTAAVMSRPGTPANARPEDKP